MITFSPCINNFSSTLQSINWQLENFPCNNSLTFQEKQMFPLTYLAFYCLLISSASLVAESRTAKGHHGHHRSPPKLFVFGDSYADTGNWPKSTAISWKKPYGMTFPGKPSGRFSDGRVLTDYIASFIGISSPLPYSQWIEFGMTKSQIQYGLNFAYGGTGVFNTLVNQPNMTTQINVFQQLIEEEEVYSRNDLNSSIALVSVAGNDYATYLAKNGTSQDLPEITKSIISQLELNLQRIHGLGVRRVGITAMQPLGCLPQMTASTSYSNCTETGNTLAKFHNQMLQQSIQKLNNETDAPKFVILDLYSAFMSALEIPKDDTGNSTFETPVLEPCCIGVASGYSCGSVNNLGIKKYVVCDDPTLSFFWDVIHPSQQGWLAVFSALKPSVENLLQ